MAVLSKNLLDYMHGASPNPASPIPVPEQPPVPDQSVFAPAFNAGQDSQADFETAVSQLTAGQQSFVDGINPFPEQLTQSLSAIPEKIEVHQPPPSVTVNVNVDKSGNVTQDVITQYFSLEQEAERQARRSGGSK
jgi:hypothetical protein